MEQLINKGREQMSEKSSIHKPHARIRSAEEIDKMPGREVANKRTATGKLFSLGENLYQAVLYSEPVHYRDKVTGEWEEIDNTLVEDRNSLGEVRLVNKQNGLMRVALGTGSKMVEIANENGETISWVVEAAKAKGIMTTQMPQAEIVKENGSGRVRANLVREATYQDIAPGTHMRYHIGSSSFKENIVFATQEAVKPISFLLQAIEMTLEPKEDGSILVLNAKQEIAFTMPAPFMLDNDSKVGNVAVALAKKSVGTWRLTYTPDEAWLQNAVFPVTLDPAVYTGNRTELAYVDSSTPTTAYPSPSNHPVMNLKGRRRLLYMRFGKAGVTSSLPAIDASCAVASAILTMPSRVNSGKAVPLHVREVLSNWNPNTLTYTNQPIVTEEDVDMAMPMTEGRIAYQLNISGIVQKWHTGENYGVVIDAREEGADIMSYSSEVPYITITYAGQAGLEDYYSFESHSIGRAGTAHVNLFNGNLVFEHADTATNGSLTPVSLTHYYNSCYRDLDIFSTGFGWKHSMHRTMHLEGGYFIYTDGDGTRHNFMASSVGDPYRGTSHEDMSGLGLRAVFTASNVRIYDKGDNSLYFSRPGGETTGRDCRYCLILETADAHGNKIAVKSTTKTVNAVSYPLNETLTDGAGRITTFTSNARGYTEKIKAPYDTNGLLFTYDTSGRLTLITYEDGLKTLFTYDSLNLITSVTNHDGRKLTFEYENYSPYRVKRVTESGGDLTGNCREYTYGHLSTTVTDRTVPGGKQMFYAFNMSGNQISVHDLLGHAAIANFTTEEPVNHPKSVSKKMRAVVNHLRNHGFETAKHWLLAGRAWYESENQLMGNRCLCFDSRISGGAMQASQTLNLTPGIPYVFSFHAKSSGAMTLRAALEYQNEQGVKQVIESPVLSSDPLYTYERLHFAFTLPHGSAKTVTIMIRGQGENGVASRAWIDSVQLEEGVLPNRYNMLVNGNFSFDCAGRPLEWIPTADTTLQDVAYIPEDMLGKPEGLTGHVLRIHGGTQKKAGYHQEIAISGRAGDVFLLGGWAKGFSASNKDNKKAFALHIAFRNEEGEYVDGEPVCWTNQRKGWQFTCGASVAKEGYTGLRLHIDYEMNINTAEFDGLFLHKEHFGQSFNYDVKGNVLSIQQLTGKKSESEYDPHDNLIQYRSPGHPKSEVARMDYGATPEARRRHLLLGITSPSGLTQQHTYDAKGNRLTSTVSGPNTSEYIKTTVTYATGDNYPSVMKDARGKAVTQEIDAVRGVVKSTTDPKGQKVTYDYDTLRRVTATTATVDGKTYRNEYVYTQDKLTEVKHNAGNDTTCDVSYAFGYDSLGNQTTVKVGSQVLSTNIYSHTGDKLLKRVEYGNGGKVHYERDAFKRLTSTRFDEEAAPRYAYDYDASGSVGRVTDAHLGVVNTYESDFANRPGRIRQMEGDTHVYTQETSYDAASRISKVREQVGEEKAAYVTEYAYDSEDRAAEIQYDVPERGVRYRYDTLGRLLSRKLLDDAEGYLTNYEYAPGGQGVGSTTGLIQSIVQPGQSFAYTYDDVGNITSENRNGAETTYAYDGLGQLIRVNDFAQGKTTQYTYDRGGNILTKKEHAYTKETPGAAIATVNYTYGDANWKDKLTAYNGQAITYDAIGNPLNDGEWTYAWKMGRQLQNVSKPNETVRFTYNADGLRVRKESTSRGVTEYTLCGKRIAHLTRTQEDLPMTEMHFWYDAQGKAAMVSYNGKDYLYVYNAQGDVVALLDKANSNSEVVAYAYDAWGKQVGCTGSMAETLGMENPFRYRGYVYDEETGLYATATRYYNPEWGRWLNGDTMLGRTGVLLSQNTFAYCRDNPVVMVDSTGLEPMVIPMIPVEQLPYMAHVLAGEPYDESMITSKYAIEGKGTGRMILSDGSSIKFTYNGIRNYYHVDMWEVKGSFEAFKTLEKPYTYGVYDPAIPIVLELDYNNIIVRTVAVVHPNPHPEACAWLLNSDGEKGGSFGTHRVAYGRDNAEVRKAQILINTKPKAGSKTGTYRPNMSYEVPY